MSQRRARLPWEVGAFIVLEVCEALMHNPVPISLSDVTLSEDSGVKVKLVTGEVGATTASRSLSGILGSILVAAGAEVPKTLVDLADHGPSGGNWSLHAFRKDIEVSLVPLNRGAMLRVLSRLIREAQRAPSQPQTQGAAALAEPARQLEDELDEVLSNDDNATVVRDLQGLALQTAGRREPKLTPTVTVAPDNLQQLRGEHEDTQEFISADPKAPSAPQKTTSMIDLGQLPTGTVLQQAALETTRWVQDPERSDQIIAPDAPTYRARPRKRYMWLGLVAIMAIIGAVAVFYSSKSHLLPLKATKPTPSVPEQAPTAATVGQIKLTIAPPQAQALLFVGKAPVEVPQVAVGTMHEFVATLPAHHAARVFIAPDVAWQTDSGSPRYEVALQLEPGVDASLGESKLLGKKVVSSVGSGYGTVRAVTTPPGALIYRLVGFGPEVQLDDVSLGRPYEILIAHQGFSTRTLLVTQEDFKQGNGKHLAHFSIQLEPLPQHR